MLLVCRTTGGIGGTECADNTATATPLTAATGAKRFIELNLIGSHRIHTADTRCVLCVSAPLRATL